jgi:double-stranded RNA-binding protein Staufen
MKTNRHPIQLLSRGNQTPTALAKMPGSAPTAILGEQMATAMPATASAAPAAAAVPTNQAQLAATAMAGAAAAAVDLDQAESDVPVGFDGTLANTKEKTPMCLINELARFNKVSVI